VGIEDRNGGVIKHSGNDTDIDCAESSFRVKGRWKVRLSLYL
jgi:hypothetical protein